MIRIAFVSRINLNSGRTNVYNFTKTCEAVGLVAGFETIFVTTDQKRDTAAFFKRLAVHNEFPIEFLSATDTGSPNGGQLWHEIKSFVAANFYLAGYLFKNRNSIDVVYFRDESLFPAAFFARGFLNKKVFFEIHSVYERKFRQFKNVFSAWVSSGIIAISTGVKKHYEKINKNVIVSLCSAAEDSWFDHVKNKKEFRMELQLPLDSYLVGYAGVVGINPNNDFYEVDDVVRSLTKLPENVHFVIVGEMNKNADWLRDIAEENRVESRIIIAPWQERAMIPKFLESFDAIIIPKRKKDLVGDSPAKMFPALASSRPIIAGRAESIEEVLTHGTDSVIVKTNTPEGWAEAIQIVMADKNLVQRIVVGAQETKKNYTWEKRGENIARFIDQTIKENK